MFQIGDRVKSLKTGLPASGTVIGMYRADFWIQTAKEFNRERWSELYPMWTDYPVYIIQLDKPQPVCSMNEFYAGVSDEIDMFDNNVRTIYEHFVAKRQTIAYPYEDLEKIDE